MGKRNPYPIIAFWLLAAVAVVLLAGCSTGSPSAVPLAPAITPQASQAPIYRLGPGDEVRVTVWRHEDLNKALVVPPSGWATFALAGDIQLLGLTPLELRDQLSAGLSKYYKDPQVSVEVTAFRSKRVYVLGEVSRPGMLYLDAPISLVEAITQAGGLGKDAKKSNVLLIRVRDREHRDVYSVDINAALREGRLEANPQLDPGDIVYVPATAIADVARYMRYIDTIISPLVEIERGVALYPAVKDALAGERGNTTIYYIR